MSILFGDQPFSGRMPGQGEKELETLTLGQRFYVPDGLTKSRLKGYVETEKLLDLDEHLKLFKAARQGSPAPHGADKYWLAIDFPGMLGRLMRHYTVGRDFRATAVLRGAFPEGEEKELRAIGQERIDRISRASALPVLLRKATEALPAYGDAVFRLDVEDMEGDDGAPIPQAVVRYVKPTNYFPDLDPLDATKVQGVTLAWVFERDQNEDTKNMVVLREIHTPGKVEWKLNAWDGSELGEELIVASMFPGLENEDTGIDEVPIVHMGYQTLAGEHWGQSEIRRVAPLVLALENRLSQEDEVLEKHARPKLIVGPGVLDDEGRANLQDFDVIEVSPDVFERAVKPEYITWNMQIQAIGHEIEKLEEYLFITTETSPASFGLERDGSQVESARALRFKAHRTVNKVSDVRDELTEDVRAVFRIAQKLELAALQEDEKEGYRRVDVKLDFGDCIVEDQTQEVVDYTMRKQAGLVSRQRALVDLDNLTPEEAAREVQEILQDQVDEAAASAATMGPVDLGTAPLAGAPIPPAGPPEPVV